MSEDLQLGTLLKGTERRDATHIAVAPVVATQILSPGDRIGLLFGSSTEVAAAGPSIPYMGIVDPFLPFAHLRVGDRFYMWLLPNTVTGMRHQWEHPAFGQERDAIDASVAWITNWAANYNLSYDDVMDNADNNDWYAGDDDSREDIPDEFWDHYARIRGVHPDSVNRQSYWRCAC